MKLSHGRYLCLLPAFLLMGLGVFLKGFFPIKKGVPGYSSVSDLLPEPTTGNMQGLNEDSQKLQPVYDRLVFVLIDALRADFVFNLSGPLMHTVSRLIEEKGSRHFLARAHPPTVTMPRIKALTSGGIPGFIDIVLNFDSEELSEDNLIEQFYRAGKRILFFGDDTWIKLFPGRFHRSDGTTSFFVTDYTEVDNNVTRHIDKELGNEDWDVMVLHYLGLDHIGHLAGPSSPLVQPKLTEMDLVITGIRSRLAELDIKSGRSSLLVVCGDHGMSEQGSHGGSSSSETATPLVMFGQTFDKTANNPPDEIYQIDMVPSLALLFGLPIPKNSLGLMQESLFSGLGARQRIRLAQVNADQLARTFLQNSDNPSREKGYLAYEEARRLHASWLETQLNASNVHVSEATGQKVIHQYIKCMEMMRSQLVSALSKYDLHAIYVGILVIVLVLTNTVVGACTCNQSIDVATDMTSLSSAVVSSCLYLAYHMVSCTSTSGSDFLCRNNLMAAVLVTLTCLLCALTAAVLLTMAKGRLYESRTATHLHPVDLFVYAGSFVHTFTLLSSSFVEEEHQTWYFLTVSAMLCLVTKISMESKSERPSGCITEKGTKNGEGCKLLDEEEENESQVDKTMALTKPEFRSQLHVMASLVAILVCCRLLRAWNQTGIKFADTPDIGDWLILPENKSFLSVLVAGALFWIILIQCVVNKSYSLLLMVALVGVYCHRSATGSLVLPGYPGRDPKGVFEAQCVYLCLLVTFIVTTVKCFTSWLKTRDCSLCNENTPKSSSRGVDRQVDGAQKFPAINYVIESLSNIQNVWLTLCVLLVRPHNIPMLALVITVESLLSRYVLPWSRLSLEGVVLLYLWFGQASFYYQGNSNSIASVDVSAGYVGLTDYQPVLVLTLLLCSTYAGLVYWLISLARYITETYNEPPDRSKLQRIHWSSMIHRVSYTVLISRALPHTVYAVLVTIQRYHLFVWTVFSPKLLYDAVFTIVLLVVGLLLSSLIRCLGSLKIRGTRSS